MSRPIRFTALRTFMESLGFRTDANPKRILFEHKPSDTVIALRSYRAKETVSPTDLAVVQTMLDQRGLVEEAAFEQALLA